MHTIILAVGRERTVKQGLMCHNQDGKVTSQRRWYCFELRRYYDIEKIEIESIKPNHVWPKQKRNS